MLAKSRAVLVGALALAAAVAWSFGAQKSPQQQRREELTKAANAGNYKDAYDGLRTLALDPKDDPEKVSDDLVLAINCLRSLGRYDEIDEFREAVVRVHRGNWRLLEAAAQTYAEVEHFGYVIAGKFHRGHHRGGGRYVNTTARDRARALQLIQQSLPLTKAEADKSAAAGFHLLCAELLVRGAGRHEAWRLQYLTDLSKLPDYEEGYGYGGDERGAPVSADGSPVYYGVPKSYEAAASDGERWRWLLARAVEIDPARRDEADVAFANFLHGQFGVQTLASGGRYYPGADEDRKDKSGTYALHTLGDDETVSRLATGIKRFTLPDEYNPIKVYRRVAGRGKSPWGERSRDMLAAIYEDRRQYVKAAEAWKTAIAEYGRGEESRRQRRLEQIVGNWGRFEPGQVQPAGAKATVDFRYRNGDKVSFEAFRIKVPTLLNDVRAYLRSSPTRLEWERVQIGSIGYLLVERRQSQYLGEKVAAWDLELKPRPGHVNDRVTVTTPLDKPGAYLLTARMARGNVSRIVVWVADTVLVKKQLEGQALYFAADAVSGAPVAGATVDFFGWKQVQVEPGKNAYRVETTSFTAKTDADGQVLAGADKMPQDHQWLVVARKDKAGAGGADRLAYLGFTNVWYNRLYDPEYNQTKVFTITDRPVYRPQQTVQFKLWVEQAKYDEPNTSAYAGRQFTVQINNPRGEKVFEKAFTADDYGGLTGEFPLPKGATLGTYQLFIPHHGGGSFRVEEYKKPEYEVQVEAPRAPVRLGEAVTATIRAKYYFGAPVTRARVKYKVLRTAHRGEWYPAGRWDWFYGRGYWWFAPNYAWYPGWRQWGCPRPVPPWWGRGYAPPEVVAENEIEIGPDGTVPVAIDTKPAKELHGDEDHQYAITAEVVDESRRTIVGTGNVLVARKPFRVFAWVDRGHYRAGDTVKASFQAQTLDQKPVEGKGELTLYKVSYDDKQEPVEKAVEKWKLDTNAEGAARLQIKAAEAGQYRLAYKVTDGKQHTAEGGYVFVVRGAGFDGREYRFNDLELITDKREYKPGEKVRLLVNTNRPGGTVLLFLRPTNGLYLPPKVLRLTGKSVEQDVAVVQRDMPNFYVEALTVAGGKVHTETREVVVPPEQRVLGVEVRPSQAEYKPGEKATVKVRLTGPDGKPFAGAAALSVYDKSVEYVAGGSNVPEIRAFFWQWRRHHSPQTETSLSHALGNLLRSGEIGMADLGTFGASVVEEWSSKGNARLDHFSSLGRAPAGAKMAPVQTLAGAPARGYFRDGADKREAGQAERPPATPPPAPPAAGGPEPTVRKNFADTALWAPALTTNQDGVAEVALTMPENLTGWKVKVWAMGHGTKVGQGEAEVVTKKNLLVRLQAPRFFVQKDEVVLSANVHNYLKAEKLVDVTLELGGPLSSATPARQQVRVPANSDRRVDWRVRVQAEGTAVVRMKAVSDEESDAMEMRFPCLVHGMLKTDSFSGAVPADKGGSSLTFTVPAERRVEEARLEVRYSPSLAAAMVDALPYLVDYPYGCTEQTLNRFLPTVITQRVLMRMNLDLKDIQKKRTNLNAQEVGDDRARAGGWKRYERNPVFDEAEVRAMTAAGVQRLAGMQLSDGGWGWFSGYGEHSYPHTTALVVHGLQVARDNDVALPPGMLDNGVAWLKNYQAEQVRRLQNAPTRTDPWKEHADNLDALVYMVLVDAGVSDDTMREFLYRDRTKLAVYAKAMFGLALHKGQHADQLAMILKNIEQFVEQNAENQTAYLRLPPGNAWWYWYGSEVEANAYYLKLLARTSPKDGKAAGLVKYLLNNRKHATYWNSTRDTAICVEAMADYLKASGEDKPDLTVEVWLDGKKRKEVQVNVGNLFTFDNAFVLRGAEVTAGKHTLEVKRKGTGPVYFNAYLTNFTLEDFITKAGLEVKVNRKYYKLTRVDKKVKVQGARGQAADQKVEKYERTELPSGAKLKSGDLVEVELEIDSANDYEYLIFEDPKPAGFETELVRSGYTGNEMGAYVELRDDRVSFFVRRLARGKHSVSYRVRAEIPGMFSALPTVGYAMYAPELKGNSDEIKVGIAD